MQATSFVNRVLTEGPARSALSRLPLVRRLESYVRLHTGRASDRLLLLTKLPKDAVGVEVGVHCGDFSQMLLDIARPRRLHLVDPWQYESGDAYRRAWYGGGAKGGAAEMEARYLGVLERFARQIEVGQVEVHRAYSSDALAQIPDGSLDFVYIDGNHLYEYVKEDLQLSLRKVKAGGVIAGDDYGPGGWWQGGVKKAVDEFGWTQGVQLVALYGDQFILRKLEE